MTTLFLKFASEAEAKSVLAVYVSPEGEWVTGSHFHALDVIGPINDQGFHINMLGTIPPEAEAYAVVPVTPDRMFA